MKKTEIRQSNIHEKLFIATGNAFDPETFGADGIAHLSKKVFQGHTPIIIWNIKRILKKMLKFMNIIMEEVNHFLLVLNCRI